MIIIHHTIVCGGGEMSVGEPGEGRAEVRDGWVGLARDRACLGKAKVGKG